MPEEAFRQLEHRVGHPQRLYDDLVERVQRRSVTQFNQVLRDWLQLMWCIDAYRVAGIAPHGMGNPRVPESRRLGAVYRMKGNWFANLIVKLLENRTNQSLAAQGRIQGFSQPHQVDVAWPARDHDPLICIETKVTGAPAYGDNPTRSALADYSNRRKEVKFAATDLKLWRRQDTPIEHWGVWRSNAAPKTYFLWAARLRIDRAPDRIEKMIREAQVLVNTYLEGAGIVAWAERSDRNGYEPIALPSAAQVSALDDVLYRVATEIRRMAPGGTPPPPAEPAPEVPARGEVIGDSPE